LRWSVLLRLSKENHSTTPNGDVVISNELSVEETSRKAMSLREES